jgi:hypothetical protein
VTEDWEPRVAQFFPEGHMTEDWEPRVAQFLPERHVTEDWELRVAQFLPEGHVTEDWEPRVAQILPEGHMTDDWEPRVAQILPEGHVTDDWEPRNKTIFSPPPTQHLSLLPRLFTSAFSSTPQSTFKRHYVSGHTSCSEVPPSESSLQVSQLAYAHFGPSCKHYTTLLRCCGRPSLQNNCSRPFPCHCVYIYIYIYIYTQDEHVPLRADTLVKRDGTMITNCQKGSDRRRL